MRICFYASRLAVFAGVLFLVSGAGAGEIGVEVEQITFGPKHHFFGYIGHVRTIPWNASGRYIVGLETTFQDHLPRADDAANVILIDTTRGDRVRVVDRTLAWNPQQGTMLYWNPRAAETQFFFNDRDPATNRIFTVLFDISKGANGERVREYRYDDASFGNSGVAQGGGSFLGLNYGRMARLRPVTGYPEAADWTKDELHPADDGIFLVDVGSGAKRLVVSFERLAAAVREDEPQVDEMGLFINHTLWNRDHDRIYFYLRGGWRGKHRKRINTPFTVRPDGSGLTRQRVFIGGHPEWEFGSRMIGAVGDRQVIYDSDSQEIVGTIGDPAIIPRPGDDIALSPDGKWFVNGYKRNGKNYYVVIRRSDGAYVRTGGFDQHGWVRGDLRNDPAPCWNRDGTAILFPAFANDLEHTRQMFRLRLRE